MFALRLHTRRWYYSCTIKFGISPWTCRNIVYILLHNSSRAISTTYIHTLLDFVHFLPNSVCLVSPSHASMSHRSFARPLGLYSLWVSTRTAALRYPVSCLLITRHLVLCALTKLVILWTHVDSPISLFLLLRHRVSSLPCTGPRMILSIFFSNDISFYSILLVKLIPHIHMCWSNVLGV